MAVVVLEAAPAGPLSVVFFDFDDTLSSSKFIKRHNSYALADRLELCNDLSDAEVLDNFGGAERVARLMQMLQRLRVLKVELRIISLGFSEAIKRHLGIVGLLEFFAGDRCILGRDSSELRSFRGKKANLIQKLCEENGWRTDLALFVDDDDRHITLCRDLGTCPFIQVNGHGLCVAEIETIERLAEAGREPAPEQVN